MLFVQTNGRLRAIFCFVKEPEKLAVIFPIPTGVVHMNKPFVLDLTRDLVERWKCITRGRRFRAQLLLLWQTQRTNASENFHPLQKEPGHSRDCAKKGAVANEVNEQIGNEQNR